MNVTEMIAEIVVAPNLETTGHEIIKSVHPLPTMSKAILRTVVDYGEVIYICAEEETKSQGKGQGKSGKKSGLTLRSNCTKLKLQELPYCEAGNWSGGRQGKR